MFQAELTEISCESEDWQKAVKEETAIEWYLHNKLNTTYTDVDPEVTRQAKQQIK